jgi:leucyl-tRNA synthetase
MSKSKKNVIDPNVLLERYGADTTRLFCLFAAPPERDLEWSDQGVDGSARFLNRVWRFVASQLEFVDKADAFNGHAEKLDGQWRALYKKTHFTIKKVTEDIENRFHFNTAISAVMELVNALYGLKWDKLPTQAAGVIRFTLETVTLLLSPFVPHFAEELWAALGHSESVLLASWPTWREDALEKDEFVIVVQVNGKLRSRFSVSSDTGKEALKEMALNDDRVQGFIAGKTIRKVIVVKNKLVNVVI